MKKTMMAMFAVALFSTSAFANNESIRADLLRAQALIDSALAKLDTQQEIFSSRKIPNAQFICREKGTSVEVEAAAKSLRQELQARCGQNCTVVLEFNVKGYDCQINGAAYPNR